MLRSHVYMYQAIPTKNTAISYTDRVRMLLNFYFDMLQLRSLHFTCRTVGHQSNDENRRYTTPYSAIMDDLCVP